VTNSVDLEYAHRYLSSGHGGFLEHVKETGSRQGQEVFAFAASNGTASVGELLQLFEALDDPAMSQLAYQRIRLLKPRPLADLAAALITSGHDRSARAALSVLLGVAKVHGAMVLSPASRLDALLLSAALHGEGSVERLWRQWATGAEPLAELPLLRVTARAASGGADQLWLKALNDLYGLENLAPLSFLRAGSDPLLTLGPIAQRKESSNYGMTVSILIAPGQGDMELTRRCIDFAEGQSVEILNWDEGRPPPVRGDACLVVQSGDWLHPSLIGRLMARLDRRNDLQAVASQRGRLTRYGKFVAVRQGSALIEKTTDVLLVRRAALESVGEECVGPPSVSSLGAQIRKRFGAKIPSATRLPLAITPEDCEMGAAVCEGFGTADRVRLEVSNAGNETGSGNRSVCAPERSLQTYPRESAGTGGADGTDLDVIYATDLRFPGGNTSITVEEIRAAKTLGFRVGVLPMTSALVSPQRGSTDRIIKAIAELGIPILDHERTVRAELVVVRHPTTVQYEDYRRSKIQARRVIVVANQIPQLSHGDQAVYDPATAVTNASHLFGVEAELVPESSVTRAALEVFDSKVGLAPFDWGGLVDTSRFDSEGGSTGNWPQIGRHSRDHRLKWPDTEEEIRAAYDIPSAEMSVLGGIDSLRGEVSPEVLRKWTVFPFGSLAVEEYLAGVDIWVYFSSSRQTESFGMAILEAMAAGCVVVLDPSLRSVYGDLACYGSPEMVSGIVAKWRQEADVRRGKIRQDVRATVSDRFGYKSYGTRLTAMIDMVEGWR